MTKKAEPTDEEKLAGAVRSSAQQIWQAGLGAFARAQEEGGKVFSRLVKESAEREAGADKSAEAAGAWDKLEQVFEERVARALEKLGLPTRDEVAALRVQVAELAAQVAALTAARAPKLPRARAGVKAQALKPAAPVAEEKAAPVKLAAARAPAKKAAPEKAAVEKAPVKKAASEKVPVEKAASEKKAPVPAPAKKAAPKKASPGTPIKKPRSTRGAAGSA
jgi:polyhydroxyalkanoate synthesis regulator phasin